MESIVVNNINVVVRNWKSFPVVTLADIDRYHQREKGTAKRNFYKNKTRFVENSDYFKLSTDEFRPMNDNPSYNYPQGAYVFTKSGYLMLVKSLNDDKAWDVQRALVNCYFDRENEQTSLATVELQPQPDQGDNIQLKMLEIIRENNQDLRKENEELRSMVKDLIALLTPTPAKERVVTPQPVEPKEPVPGVSYSEFKRQINKACEEIIAFHNPKYKDKNAILHEAYARIRKEYGLVYDQEKKEYAEEIGTSPISTLELQWYVEQKKPVYRNMLLCKLNNIYNEVKKNA